jgi:HEAT repeat protein
MDYAVTFARHFSRLVWLLLHESKSIDEQKASLRAALTVLKEGPIRLATQDWRLIVNGEPLSEGLTGVPDLAAQLIGHAVLELIIDRGALPADVLGVARILSGEAVPGDGGASIQNRLKALSARTVRVTVKGVPPVVAPLRTPLTGVPAVAPAAVDLEDHTPSADASGLDTMNFDRADGAPPAIAKQGPGVLHGTDFMYSQFASAVAKVGSEASLFAQLDSTKSVSGTTRVLDELVTIAENLGREGGNDTVADIFFGIVQRESAVTEVEMKRAYVMAIRRLAKPTLLRVVAQMLPRNRQRVDECMSILIRAGEDGADALIEQLTNAPSLSDRRVYFDSLVKLNAGVPALIHMLGDARWYVARNAADLLGEMAVPEAEVPLSELLKHDDDRVRRAAASALAKLGTPRAMDALHHALQDNASQVRLQAAIGLAARKGLKSATTLSRALDAETDIEVQLAILAALGRLATPDAVQKLIKAAEPEGRLFRKKSVAYRVAAVQALGESRVTAAMNALTALVHDRDKEVREAVVKALTHVPNA